MTFRDKLYVKATKSLKNKCKDAIQTCYNECIELCEKAAEDGKYESRIPKQLEDMLNKSNVAEYSTIIRGVEELLKEQDLYIRDYKQNKFDAPKYMIKFDTQSNKDLK